MAPSSSSLTRRHWWHRLLALVALLNLLLVMFDLSYLHWRDVYLQVVPSLTQVYDPVKAIQSHPETQDYLNQVDRLNQQISQTGLQSPETETLLAELRQLSQQMSQDNPFEEANKPYVLAKIKQEVRDRTGEPMARDGFATFWSAPYLSQAGWQAEADFFNTNLRPLIAANYYRDSDRYGLLVDRFWLLDLPFIFIFAIDFLVRTYHTSRRRPDLTWLEAILRRWYDLFLLLPFWRWLRVVPVTIRLYESRLFNLEPLRAQLNHDFAVSFAQELTEMVGIQVIDQVQDTIHQGDLARWLLHPETRRPYVQVNHRDEVTAIATRLIQVSVYDVLPQVQPDVEELIRHGITNTLSQAPLYQQLQMLPGINEWPAQIAENLAKTLSQSVYNSLTGILADPVGAEITARLTQNFRNALEQELQKNHNLQEIQALLVDLLEEIKINYVESIAKDGMARAIEEAEQLQRARR
uniref:hypothetical protein n=1 Tax=Trichocoleus desertorum TaxID=1481672 RepID=UPI0025B3383C|nr:hypothetical protein [Trichocoleus desertorum]